MSKLRSIWLVFFTGFLCISGCGDEEPEEMLDEMVEEQALDERLQEIVNSKVGANQLVGVFVSIRVGREERWNLVGGLSDGASPITSDMRFGIGSITKTVVAATIMKLQEKGLLDIGDPIGDHLTLESPYVSDSITIFQLLNHFTGLHGYFRHPDIWPQVEENLEEAIVPTDLVDFIQEPFFLPGERFEYSNSNYLVLGLVIESVTGKTVGEVMREEFWGPLNLTETYFGSNEPIQGSIAAPWRDTDGDGQLENIADQFGPAYHSVFYTAADVFTTASDLSLWAQELFNGNALTDESQEAMVDFVTLGDPIFTGYGLGIREVFVLERTLWGHTGGMRGYGSFMFYDPVSEVSIALLNNQSRSINGPELRGELFFELLEAVFEELENT